MIIRISKILNDTDLARSGSHGGLVVHKKYENLLIDFFEEVSIEKNFKDEEDDSYFNIKYENYSSNGVTPNDRVTPIKRYATKYNLEPGDKLIFKKHINGNAKSYFIGYSRRIKSIFWNGTSFRKAKIINLNRFYEFVSLNEPLGDINKINTNIYEMDVLYGGNIGKLTLIENGTEFEIYYNGDAINIYRKYLELKTDVRPFLLREKSTWEFGIEEEIEVDDIVEDIALYKDINEEIFDDSSDEYSPIPEVKRDLHDDNSRKSYPRSKKKAINAIKRANYTCQYDETHESFIRKNTNLRYVEPHHLIPIEFSELFKYSLDVEANIVSLCSNCHNKIHYGEGSEDLLKKLWELKKEEINMAGLGILKNNIQLNFDVLKSIYGIK